MSIRSIQVGIILCGFATASAKAPLAHALNERTEMGMQMASHSDGSGPVGVMGAHAMARGGFMLSYRHMRMSMAGHRDGTNELTTQDVLGQFMVAPLDMSMTMHMAGFMYAPSDAVTLMAMGGWLDIGMNHQTRAGMQFAAESSGLGDASLGALIGLRRHGSMRAHLNAAVSIPVGSIEATSVTPMSQGAPVQLPYPMQLGSGTWDVMPGVTLLRMGEGWSWGLQGMGRLRTGNNKRGYRRGHGATVTGWFALRPWQVLGLSVRTEWRQWGNYSGHDSAYANPMMAPTIRAELRGGRRLDLPVGVSVDIQDGILAGHRLAVEWHVPVYQSLHGPQLASDWMLTAGWQKAFHPH